MGARNRICGACVYCSFAGNCDRYDKPLTSIELPACDAYEIHPLIAENEALRELVRKLHDELVSCEENEYIPGGHKFDGDVRELGVEVDG